MWRYVSKIPFQFFHGKKIDAFNWIYFSFIVISTQTIVFAPIKFFQKSVRHRCQWRHIQYIHENARLALCLTTPPSCYKFTVKHGFLGLIASIYALNHNFYIKFCCSFQQQTLISLTRFKFKLINWLVLEGLLPFSAWNLLLMLWTTQVVIVSWLETFLLDKSICWLINMSGSLNKNTLYLVLQGVHWEYNFNLQRQNKTSMMHTNKTTHRLSLVSMHKWLVFFFYQQYSSDNPRSTMKCEISVVFV